MGCLRVQIGKDEMQGMIGQQPWAPRTACLCRDLHGEGEERDIPER